MLTLRSASAVALTAVLLLASAGPSGQPVEAADPDVVTVVTLDSEPGEYYGLGLAHTYVQPETILASGASGSVEIRVRNDTISHTIDLRAPDGEAFVVGPYDDASSAGGTHPTVGIILNSSGCSSAAGRFDVLEVPTFDEVGTVLAFAADFEIRCGSSTKTLYGKVRIASTVPIRAIEVSPEANGFTFPSGTILVAGSPTTMQVRNVGNTNVSVTGLTTSGPDSDAFLTTLECSSPLAPGLACSVDVVPRPTRSPMSSGTVTIESDAVRWGWKRDFWAPANFAPATNESAATSILIDALPFGHGGALSDGSSAGGTGSCPADYGSLWYRYTTPTKRVVELDPGGSQSPVALMVRAGTSTAVPFLCGQDTAVTFTAEPGVMYWIQVQRKYDSSRNGWGLILRARQGAVDDHVDVSGMGVSATKFYPVKDKYKDTVLVRGVRPGSIALGEPQCFARRGPQVAPGRFQVVEGREAMRRDGI